MTTSTDVEGYALGPRLGAGPRGAVHVATQASLGRRVALKLYAAGGAPRAWPEHAGVARLFAAGPTASGDSFTAAQLAPASLAGRLAAGDIGRAEALALCDQAEATLAELKVAHGAISAGNVLIGADGRALLCDFGMPGVEATAQADRKALAALRKRCAALDERPRGDDAAAGPSSRRRVLAAALAGAVALGATAVIVLGGDDGPPRPLAGSQALGSTLSGLAPETVGCDGRAPDGSSLPCTVVQARRDGRRLAFAADGTVRRWAVRGARGTLTLQIVRADARGRYVVVASSPPQDVPDAGVHAFDAELAVRPGDRFGVEVRPGAGIGVSGADGATTLRFVSPLRPGVASRRPEQGARTGFDRALELRVEYEPS